MHMDLMSLYGLYGLMDEYDIDNDSEFWRAAD